MVDRSCSKNVYSYYTENLDHSKGIVERSVDPSPSLSVSESFYLKLRERDKSREIVKPYNTKPHSSLERTYNGLKLRMSYDLQK